MKMLLLLLFCYVPLPLIWSHNIMPIVLWHGMGDTCCNPLTLGFIIKILKNKLNDVHIYSVKMGQSFIEDMEDGYFLDVNEQIKIVCDKLKNDSRYNKGYNAIGFSQGGQFLRGLAQRCPQPPMHNLISLGGQHQGVYGLPRCPGIKSLCDKVRYILNTMAYREYVQKHLVQSQFWHDPMNETLYKANSSFLGDINQERSFNPSYKANLMKLNKLVLIKFLKDSIVIPRESEWFGFYKPGSNTILMNMNQTDLYQKDLLGLKEMQDNQKLDLLSYPDDHLRFDVRWFEQAIISTYLNVAI